MSDEVWEKLNYKWTEDPQFNVRREQAKANRAKGPKVTHMGGSMDYDDFVRKLKEKDPKHRDPSFVDVIRAKKMHHPKEKDKMPTYIDEQTQEYTERLNAKAIQKYGEDTTTWPTTVDVQLLSQVSGGRLYGMPIYMDPEEQGLSHHKRPPHPILDNSVQSSQQVAGMQGGMHGGMQGWMDGGMQGWMQGDGGAGTSGGA
ncbi:hypothetical protein SLEP1_g23845 [Rubroshorea leprosula]|uniref:Uncharacterized protein n=1 Tax=Rubroshorea leprosula TaxID=152421 RepID=A0AAV5JDN0_9ROSI|nr:hypothetical protein SLEP1_g23845 [Rubroshorea leprosula]